MSEKIVSKLDVLLWVLLGALTAAYSWFVYLCLNAYSLLVVQSHSVLLPFFSKMTTTHPHVWQALAVASLIINVAWAKITADKNRTTSVFVTAAILHTGWLFLCLLLHAIGMLYPLISRAYIIK